MKKLFIIGILLSFISLTAIANTWQTQVQSTLDQWRMSHEIPGAALLINKNGQLYHFVSGTTTLHGQTPISSTTLFGVGSITKTFVTAQALMLVSQGRLHLDDTLGQYLPQYPRWQKITLKELLNMTSGIPDFYHNQKFLIAISTDPNTHYTPDQLINLIYQQPDNFAPGTQWDYSNTNTLLVGKIIAKVTQQSLANNLEHSFFIPLKLDHTFYSDTTYSAPILAETAHGYYNDIDMTSLRPSNYGAAGAMLMSAGDINTWITALLIKHTVLPQQQLTEMLTPTPVPKTTFRPADTSYGLGIFISDHTNMGKIIWYSGVTQGYSSSFTWIPQHKLLIIAQINGYQDENFNLLFPNNTLVQSVYQILQKNI